MSPLLLTLSLQDDSILLNDGILDALDRPRQVQVMINEEARMLLLRACTVDDLQAVVIPAGQHVMQCEISGRSLLKKIRKFTGWDDDRPRVCEGEYLPNHQAIRFDLMQTALLPDDMTTVPYPEDNEIMNGNPDETVTPSSAPPEE